MMTDRDFVEDVTEGTKLRVTMTHDYIADPANYPAGSGPEDMARIDKENGFPTLLCDLGSDNFDAEIEVIGNS